MGPRQIMEPDNQFRRTNDTGKAMRESHAHLNISDREWGVMANEFHKSLDAFKVPAAEQKELFDIVGTTKADIVVRE